MPIPAAVGVLINIISNALVGVPVHLTKVAIAMWGLKYSETLEPGTLDNFDSNPDRQAIENKIAEDFMRDNVCTPTDTDGNGIPDFIDELKEKFGTAEITRSPIVLDLNGDGIATTAVTDGAYFDHDANGFAEATGWVNSEDGILVRDLDGSGAIDTGRELFGSETILSDGSKTNQRYRSRFLFSALR